MLISRFTSVKFNSTSFFRRLSFFSPSISAKESIHFSSSRFGTISTIYEVCDTKLINEGTRLYCPNEACPKRVYHHLVKWLKKLNVKHFSEKLMLRPLFDTGKVNN